MQYRDEHETAILLIISIIPFCFCQPLLTRERLDFLRALVFFLLRDPVAQLLGEWRPDEAMEVVMVVEFVMLARLAAVAGEGLVVVVAVEVTSPGELLTAVSVVEVMVVLGEVVVVTPLQRGKKKIVIVVCFDSQ